MCHGKGPLLNVVITDQTFVILPSLHTNGQFLCTFSSSSVQYRCFKIFFSSISGCCCGIVEFQPIYFLTLCVFSLANDDKAVTAISDTFRDYVCLERNMQFNVITQFWHFCLLFTLFLHSRREAMPRYIWSIFKSICVFMYLNQVFFSVGILKLNFQKPFCFLFCLCVPCFLLWKWNPSSSLFLPLYLIIGSSLSLSLPPPPIFRESE